MWFFQTFNLPYILLSCDNELHFFSLGVTSLFTGLRCFNLVLGSVRVLQEYDGPVWSRLSIFSRVAAEAAKGHY